MEAAGVIYLDANATTPLLPEVLDAMLPWLRDGFANPSGAYAGAKLARKAIDTARGQVADLLGADPEEIIFTGGGTESVNTALWSLHRLAGEGAVVVSAIEHSAVLRYVETLGREVRLAPVDAGGRVILEKFSELLDGAAFASVMAANNETGVIQPLAELVRLSKEKGVPFHSDAIQAVGKTGASLTAIGADMLSISAHKFHGPKGVGALWIRKGLRFTPLISGGGQESGRRSGTENVPGIVGMGAASVAMKRSTEDGMLGRVREIRNAFEAAVLAEVQGVTPNGARDHRLPNTCHLSFEGCEAAGLLILLDDAGVACSAGSACMTGKQKPSHVQLAMGIPEELAKSSLRISFSLLSTMEDAMTAAEALKKAVEKLRRVQGLGVGPVQVYTP
ncbi:cysteine desulfurase family protein [Luteolibacter sp. SL250]|uniref:cysteine desulfurase family protein n=1 Tax=Luteolibacter sp. SL250 TaxID=2995170 RepID=UPI002271FEE8|nr:cysteine desulfurase family protein [Luteolibacter sp. SL250]WAC18345.1 cysteine desulfurase family protein [Luteolibacter sp. SL250]